MSRVHSEFKTKKGTTLPLLNLKGKPYLQVAHRIAWLAEEVEHYNIETSFNTIEYSEYEDGKKVRNGHASVKARITLFSRDAEGKLEIAKMVTANKFESEKNFPDYIEKAETGAIGRALALAGYGTQFTGDELDEVSRLADSPVTPAKRQAESTTQPSAADGFNLKSSKTAAASKKTSLL